jgi:hypothetical protein
MPAQTVEHGRTVPRGADCADRLARRLSGFSLQVPEQMAGAIWDGLSRVFAEETTDGHRWTLILRGRSFGI